MKKHKNPEQYALQGIANWAKQEARNLDPRSEEAYAWRLTNIWALAATSLLALAEVMEAEKSAKERTIAHFKATLQGEAGQLAVKGQQDKVKVYTQALQRIRNEIKALPAVRPASMLKQMRAPVTDNDEARI